MQYLDATEYVAYGLEPETSDSVVAAASAMIDAFCRRPSLGIVQYVERVRCARHRESFQLTYLPLASADGQGNGLIGVRGKFFSHCQEHWNELGALLSAASASEWVPLDTTTLDVASDSGCVGLTRRLGASARELEVTYTAGFSAIPTPVKIACAQIVRNALAMPALTVKRQAIDNIQMEYFSASLLDQNVQMLLTPYVSERVG